MCMRSTAWKPAVLFVCLLALGCGGDSTNDNPGDDDDAQAQPVDGPTYTDVQPLVEANWTITATGQPAA